MTSLDTDLSVAPFFDDFDETKGFHRVLHRPAVPVQTRELNQLQSILGLEEGTLEYAAL